jgi:hypothetical protein
MDARKGWALGAGLSLALLGPLAARGDAQSALVICKRGRHIKLRERCCTRGEKRVDASALGVTGPSGSPGRDGSSGPAGRDGSNGQDGPAGLPGGPGLSGWEKMVSSGQVSNLPNGSLASRGVSCSAGKKPLGGGADAQAAGIEIEISAPAVADDGWQVAWRNNSGSTATFSYIVYVVCADVG